MSSALERIDQQIADGIYADLLAARDRQWVNERLDTIWRLGGFVLSVRDAVCRIRKVNGR